MSLIPGRRLLNAIIALIFLTPLISKSQVTIKEKVEIRPRSQGSQVSSAKRNPRSSSGSYDFFNPPLFVDGPRLALKSNLTISGTVTVNGDIGYNQQAIILNADGEYQIAWKTRAPLGWGGGIEEVSRTQVGTFPAGSYPDIQLWLFDNAGWGSGGRIVTSAGSSLNYAFNGFLYYPYLTVTGIATASGAFDPASMFNRWDLAAGSMTVTGRDSTQVVFSPLDGSVTVKDTGVIYGAPYSPVGIPMSDAEITVSVAGGNYVYLAYQEMYIDWEIEEFRWGAYHRGKQLTMPMYSMLAFESEWISIPNDVYLIYDEREGSIDGSSDTVYVTVSGGGKSKTIPVILRRTQILLGETRYYQAIKDPADNTKLSFKEFKETNEAGNQDFSKVNFGVQIEQGGKLGVYWENKNQQGDDFRGDVIRLVGKYWEKDKIYSVKLSGTAGSASGSEVILVQKPAKLGSTHKKAMSVSNQEYDLDDLIVEHAGREGILPQYIKAIISKETMGFFDPCYRYEPLDDMTKVQIDGSGFDSNHQYWIEEGVHLDDIPAVSNLRDALGRLSGYPGYKRVWDFYQEKNAQANKMYTGAVYHVLKEKWEEYYYWTEKNQLLADHKTESEAIAIASDSAYARRDRWLKYEIGEGGMIGKTAQTRIAASYGLMQLTYYYGVNSFKSFGYNYPNDDGDYKPEDINANDKGFRYQLLHFKGKLRNALGNVLFVDPTWQSTGLEKAYEMGLKLYNSGGDYAPTVIELVQSFLPAAQ